MTAAELISHYAEVRARLNPEPSSRQAPARPRVWIAPRLPPKPRVAPVTVKTASSSYRVFQEPLPETMEWQRIVNKHARLHNVDPREILAKNRARPVIAAYTDAVIEIRDTIVIQGKPVSFPTIAKWFGRDHTSLVHAYWKGRK